VGHILFTPAKVRGESGTVRAMALGPMAVLPEHQNRGIGSELVTAGLDLLRSMGERVVFVVGHREYYPRFGFEPAAPMGLHYKSPDFDPHFMVAELVPGALQGLTGTVEYLPPFDAA
jgi:putative acetyltransferase